jgi:hypothetical protein
MALFSLHVLPNEVDIDVLDVAMSSGMKLSADLSREGGGGGGDDVISSCVQLLPLGES